METATELFSRQGYGQTGVNEIIKRARATSGSFYHFFPAKEDLVLAVLDHAADTLESEVFSPANAADDPIERIFTVLTHYRRHLVATDFALGSPVGGLAVELSETHPQVRAKAAEIFDTLVARIESFIDQAAGSLGPGLDRRGLAELVLCTLEGALVVARAQRSPAPFDAAMAQLRRFLDLSRQDSPIAEEAPTSVRPPLRRPPATADWRTW